MKISRKNKIILISIILLCVILFGTTFILFRSKDLKGDIAVITFSKEAGFYEKGFELTISTSCGTVYYTLDGSTPTNQSYKYTGPIYIDDASEHPNVYSMRTDTSTGFYTELLDKYQATDPEYSTPSSLIDKCTIVRAVAYSNDVKCSEIKTESYFVGFDDKTGYDNVNIVSIVTDPENLFGYEDGIYVTGKNFDNFMNDIEASNSTASHMWSWWNSNYSHEHATEKVAFCQFFVNDELVLSQECGINIHGGGTRGFNPKSLNIYARREYGNGYNVLPYQFFEQEYYPHKVTLFQGGDDDASKMQDYIVHKLTGEMNYCTMEFEPYVLFLDGEYWGVYWLTEKYDGKYIQSHYGVDDDNAVIIKNDTLAEGTDADLENYYAMQEFFKNADLSQEEQYTYACTLVDVDSFTDYFATMIYLGRGGDWPQSNLAMWRSREYEDGEYGDTKWRYVLYDLNSQGMTINRADHDSYEEALRDNVFSAFMQREEVRNELLDKVLERSDKTFSGEAVETAIKDFRAIMDEPIKKNAERFWKDGSTKRYEDRINNVSSFLRERHNYIDELVEMYR